MPYVRRTKRRPSATKRAKIITVGCLGLAGTLALSGLYLQQQETLARNATEAASFAPTASDTTDSATQFAPVPEVMARLADNSKPWTLTVLGDSTGNAEDEWVYLAAKSLGEQHDRPVIIHNWSVESNTYESATSVGEGAGQPIVVWNGSASGAPPTYSNEHRATLAPQPSDLVIINHGHNMGDVEKDINQLSKLADWALTNQETPPAMAVTLQNPRLDEQSARQAQIVDRLEISRPDRAAIIDVHTAFTNAGDVATLVQEDGFHPNAEGEMIWAETVLTALQA